MLNTLNELGRKQNSFANFVIGRPVFLALIILFSVSPADALILNVTYDSSVTNIGTLAQVQTGFNAAMQTIQTLYTNDITVNITVYSEYAGPFGYIELGESQTEFTGSFSFKYPQLTNALRLARTTAADTNSVASLPASDPTGGTTNMWWIPRAEAKALNVLISPTAPATDGEVGFATNVTYTFDPNNRAVAGEFDFIGIAEHELTEAMGRTTFDFESTNYVPYDLFRFTNSGGRSFNINATNAYFSVDDGVTVLKYFYTNANLGDIQDWQSSSPEDSYDAFVSAGNELILSSADLTTMDVLGYNLNYKAPTVKEAKLGNGNFQLNFTNTPGMGFVVQTCTNLSTDNWTDLGAPAENPAGQYQFTDTATVNNVRFYRVKLP